MQHEARYIAHLHKAAHRHTHIHTHARERWAGRDFCSEMRLGTLSGDGSIDETAGVCSW
jgi:hypothetical protein